MKIVPWPAGFAGLLVMAGTLQPVAASTFRVDDSGTVLSPPAPPMRWRQLVPGRAGDHTIEGQLSVMLRLNLSPWLHRPARLYLLLAPTESAHLVATWRTQGRLLPGAVRGGGRTLVFDGLVREALLQETLLLSLSADGRAIDRALSLQFSVEIEVSP
jgi:hypothetical protein